ncbi:MFS transporter [Streptomyces sp. NPDC127049]|uniref:MFS transporter n=1 Tax=Streptomyces sp. NPDC127049 TaxID=3347118 RepID=UPI003668B77F
MTASDLPSSDRPGADVPTSDRPAADRPTPGRAASDVPTPDRAASDAPTCDRTASDGCASDRPTSDGSASDSSAPDGPASAGPDTATPDTATPDTATPEAGDGGVGDTGAGSVRAVVGLLVLFELTSGFLQGGIAPLLPEIGRELGIRDADLTWVLSAQLLAAAVSVPVLGRLGDLHGHRRVLRWALASVAVGTLLVALAPNLEVLLLGRVLTGPLAALLPLEIALVRDRLPLGPARSAIARLVGALALGTLLGGVLTGAVHELADDVRLTLLLPVVLAVACVPVSFLAIPESRRLARGRLDLPGAVLLSATMLLLLSGVSAAQDDGPGPSALIQLGLAVLLGVVWTRVELRTAEPLVDVRALADRRVAPFFLCAFAFGVVYFGGQAPDATFLAADPATTGYGFGLSALSISLVALPAAATAVVTASLTARIAGRTGYVPALAGSFALVAASFLTTAVLHTAIWQLVAAKILAGLGLGVALGAMPTVIAEASDPSRTGVTTALYNNVKTLGGAVAGGVMAAVLTASATQASDTPAASAYVTVWLICAGVAAAAPPPTQGARPPPTPRAAVRPPPPGPRARSNRGRAPPGARGGGGRERVTSPRPGR